MAAPVLASPEAVLMPTRREQLIEEASRAKIPVAALDPECKWVPSREQAIIDAFNQIPAGDVERAGAVYRNEDGNYCYSVPVPGTERSFSMKLSKGDYPGKVSFDSIYHTHPQEGHRETGISSENFSAADVQTAKKLGKHSFIRNEHTGEIKHFDPATGAVDRYNGGARGVPITRREALAEAYDKIRKEGETS